MEIKAICEKGIVITENSQNAKELYEKKSFGTQLPDGRIKLSLIEALYLTERKKITIYTTKKKLTIEEPCQSFDQQGLCPPFSLSGYFVFLHHSLAF